MNQRRNAENASEDAVSGHFFETFVVSELLKSYTNAGKQEDFYYLRDSNGREIDLLLYQDYTLFPLEMNRSPLQATGYLAKVRTKVAGYYTRGS